MRKATRFLLYTGPRFDLYEVVVDDRHLLREFIDELSEADQKKLVALFKHAAEHGPPRNEQKFKKLSDDLFEFKSFQIRIFCAFRGKSILVLTHGIKKKKDRHDQKDLQKAREILAMLDEREG